MNIFFDVDYTILGLDNSLRPETKEVFQRLVDEGHLVYIWSGQGERWEVVRKFELEPLLSGVYEKPLSDFHNRLEGLGVPVVPDFIIDDYPEITAAFGGMWIRPYFFKDARDQEIEHAYRIITEFARTGTSKDRNYRAKGTRVPLF